MMVNLGRHKLILITLIIVCAVVAVCAVLGVLSYRSAGVVMILLASGWGVGAVLRSNQRSTISLLSPREEKRERVTAFEKWDSATKSKAKTVPWLLLMGAPGSGKSQLSSAGGRAAHVNIDIQIPKPNDGGTLPVRYVLHTYGVTIDCPGRIGVGGASEDEIWRLMLREVDAFRGSVAPINGVGLVVGVDELLGSAAAATDASRAKEWRRRLTQVHDETRHYVPIYIVITKLDLIGGFESLFGSDELVGARAGVFGWSTDKPPSVGFDPKGVTDGLAHFLTNVREFARKIQAVHQCQPDRAEATRRIAEVELAVATIETLVERVTEMVNSLFGDNELAPLPVFLRGIYLTAAAPDEERVARLTPSDGEWSHLAVSGPASRAAGTRRQEDTSEPLASYFVRNLWESKIFKEHGLACIDSAGRMHLVKARYVAWWGTTAVAAVWFVVSVAVLVWIWQWRQPESLRPVAAPDAFPPALAAEGNLVAWFAPEWLVRSDPKEGQSRSLERITLVEWQNQPSLDPRVLGQVPLSLGEPGLPFDMTPVAATRAWARTRLLAADAGGYSTIPSEGLDPTSTFPIPSSAARDGRIREWHRWNRRTDEPARVYQVLDSKGGEVRARMFDAPSPAWFEATAFVSTTMAPVGTSGTLASGKSRVAATWDVWGVPRRLGVPETVELVPPAKLSLRASCAIDTSLDGATMIGAACYSEAPPETAVKHELFSDSHFGVIWIDGVGLTSELILPSVAGSDATTTHRRFVPLGMSATGEVIVGCVLTKGSEKLKREAAIGWIDRRGPGGARIRFYSVREILAARTGVEDKRQLTQYESWESSEAWDVSQDGRVLVGRSSMGKEVYVWTLRLGLSESP
jgi:hypothetical protein